jgi:antitoxin (DNA-binding transcriptional repressor) of toxin-antitoxin stability system
VPARPTASVLVYTRATVEPMEDAAARVGIRELRNQVATVVRRAAAGERLVVTVDGVATAQLGPLTPPGEARLTLDDLVAAGLVQPPNRPDRPTPPPAEDVPVDVRIDDVLDDLRGR